MSLPTLDCPYAKYVSGMMIRCEKRGQPCGNVFYKQCKGWWALTPAAAACPIRKEKDDNGKDETVASGRD